MYRSNPHTRTDIELFAHMHRHWEERGETGESERETCSRMQPLRRATTHSSAFWEVSPSPNFSTISNTLFFMNWIPLLTHSGPSLRDIIASKSWTGFKSPISSTLILDVYSIASIGCASEPLPISSPSSLDPDGLSLKFLLVDFFSCKVKSRNHWRSVNWKHNKKWFRFDKRTFGFSLTSKDLLNSSITDLFWERTSGSGSIIFRRVSSSGGTAASWSLDFNSRVR